MINFLVKELLMHRYTVVEALDIILSNIGLLTKEELEALNNEVLFELEKQRGSE